MRRLCPRHSLRDGARVRLHANHNCQGAQQPGMVHIGAKAGGAAGCGVVVGRDDVASCYKLVIEGCSMRLGQWWVEAATRGAVPNLPVVNAVPVLEGSMPK